MSNSPRFAALTGLIAAGLLAACGGGGGDGGGAPPAAGSPQPTPSAALTLTTANYAPAAKSALRTASLAFDYARAAGETVALMLDQPVNYLPNFPCREGGTVSLELTDLNRNGYFNEHDGLRMELVRCVTNGVRVSGLIRLELQTVMQYPDERDYDLTFEFIGLVVSPGMPNGPAQTVDYNGTLQLSRGTDHEHWVLTFGNFRMVEGADALTAGALTIDYSQRYDQGTYEYLVQAGLEDSRLAGQFRVTTPAAFTGIIGEFPTAGRLTLTGAGAATSSISEPDSATDATHVAIALDANGDGTSEEQQPPVPWTDVTYSVFGSLRNSPGAAWLPLR